MYHKNELNIFLHPLLFLSISFHPSIPYHTHGGSVGSAHMSHAWHPLHNCPHIRHYPMNTVREPMRSWKMWKQKTLIRGNVWGSYMLGRRWRSSCFAPLELYAHLFPTGRWTPGLESTWKSQTPDFDSLESSCMSVDLAPPEIHELGTRSTYESGRPIATESRGNKRKLPIKNRAESCFFVS